jgi:hypothetical protein
LELICIPFPDLGEPDVGQVVDGAQASVLQVAAVNQLVERRDVSVGAGAFTDVARRRHVGKAGSQHRRRSRHQAIEAAILAVRWVWLRTKGSVAADQIDRAQARSSRMIAIQPPSLDAAVSAASGISLIAQLYVLGSAIAAVHSGL